MRTFCAAAFLLISSPALACTAGGRPCDEVYSDQLKKIDQTRMDNIRRDNAIREQQHQNELAAIRRQRELEEAKRAPVQPRQTIPTPTQQTGATPNSGLPAECRAFPTLCSAYK